MIENLSESTKKLYECLLNNRLCKHTLHGGYSIAIIHKFSSELGELCGVKLRTIKYALKELAESNILHIFSLENKYGIKTSKYCANFYAVLVDNILSEESRKDVWKKFDEYLLKENYLLPYLLLIEPNRSLLVSIPENVLYGEKNQYIIMQWSKEIKKIWQRKCDIKKCFSIETPNKILDGYENGWCKKNPPEDFLNYKKQVYKILDRSNKMHDTLEKISNDYDGVILECFLFFDLSNIEDKKIADRLIKHLERRISKRKKTLIWVAVTNDNCKSLKIESEIFSKLPMISYRDIHLFKENIKQLRLQ